MNETLLKVRCRLTAAIFGLVLSAPVGLHAALDDIVVVRGTSTNEDIGLSLAFSPDADTPTVPVVDVELAERQEICRNLEEIARSFLSASQDETETPIADAVRQALYDAITGVELPSPADQLATQVAPRIEEAAENLEQRCQNPTADGNYTVIFTTCSMLMKQGGQLLQWTVPPDAPQPTMIIADAQTREILASSNLATDFAALQRVAPDALGRTNPGGGSRVTSDGPAEPVELIIDWGQPELWLTSVETYAAENYTHSYNGRLQLTTPLGPFPFATITANGSATLSSEVPGWDVIAQFYQNFSNYVTPNVESSTIVAEMIKHTANVAANGVPISFAQTTAAQMLMGPGVRSTSTTDIERIGVYFGGASRESLCGNMSVPEGWTFTDIDAMMTEAMEGIEEAQQGLGGLADQLPPGFDLGGLIPGIASEPAAVPSAAREPSGPSSADLMTGDMTESVQLHLEALGYDPGNTAGELSVITQIAISQFQADMERPVTGEVSPQLLGILGAEVDRAR